MVISKMRKVKGQPAPLTGDDVKPTLERLQRLGLINDQHCVMLFTDAVKAAITEQAAFPLMIRILNSLVQAWRVWLGSLHACINLHTERYKICSANMFSGMKGVRIRADLVWTDTVEPAFTKLVTPVAVVSGDESRLGQVTILRNELRQWRSGLLAGWLNQRQGELQDLGELVKAVVASLAPSDSRGDSTGPLSRSSSQGPIRSHRSGRSQAAYVSVPGDPPQSRCRDTLLQVPDRGSSAHNDPGVSSKLEFISQTLRDLSVLIDVGATSEIKETLFLHAENETDESIYNTARFTLLLDVKLTGSDLEAYNRRAALILEPQSQRSHSSFGGFTGSLSSRQECSTLGSLLAGTGVTPPTMRGTLNDAE